MSNIKETDETKEKIKQLNSLIQSHIGCKKFQLFIEPVKSPNIILFLKNGDEIVSHINIGCEYYNCEPGILHIMTATSEKYQRQNYNQFLTAIMIILAGTLTYNDNRFTQIADFTTVKARMNVLKKYELHKSNNELMTDEEKQAEIDNPDGVYSIILPLFDEDELTHELTPHLNQQIAWDVIHKLLNNNEKGIFCAQNSTTNGGKRKTKGKKSKKKRRNKHKKTYRLF